jgi:threonine dehydrogenase-like Zn-dependent dehydrogenase
MKAFAVTPSQREIGIVEVPDPGPPGPNQVRFRVLEVGICGTDREICGFHYGFPPPGEESLVIGHECLGEVESVGEGVMVFSPGDLVVPVVRLPCKDPHCLPCSSQEQDFCRTGGFYERGIKEAHGFMTEVALDSADHLHPVPDHLRQVAVLAEPLSIAEKAIIQIDEIQNRLPWTTPDKLNVVILGAGPIGLLGAMAFLIRGFQTVVYSLEPDDHPKARLVRDIGGTYICSRTHDLPNLDNMVEPMDVVYEAAGAPQIAFELLRYLDHNGVYVFTGVPGEKPAAEMEMAELMRNMVLKNQAVLGTVNAGHAAYTAALEDLEAFEKAWPGILDRIITGRFPLSGIEPLVGPEATGIKNIIDFTLPLT